jgi:hypothetical protein
LAYFVSFLFLYLNIYFLYKLGKHILHSDVLFYHLSAKISILKTPDAPGRLYVKEQNCTIPEISFVPFWFALIKIQSCIWLLLTPHSRNTLFQVSCLDGKMIYLFVSFHSESKQHNAYFKSMAQDNFYPLPFKKKNATKS